MTSNSAPILVVGATGALGGVVARKLLAAGFAVRALGRNREKLAALRASGAEVVAADLLDGEAVSQACAGASQVFTSANNVMGTGTTSPNRVDLAAHRNLCDAAARHGVMRLVYVSGRAMGGRDSPVDFFRLKHQIEEMVRQSRVPFVLFRPTAFMETWVDMMCDGIRAKGVAVLFGDGRQVSNFIAIEDAAEFALQVLRREEIVNDVVEVGGPSNVSFAHVAELVERQFGVKVGRRRIPVAVLRAGSLLLRPFNEVVSRQMSLGYFVATRDGSFPEWQRAAERFGVSPMTVDAFVARRFSGPAQG